MDDQGCTVHKTANVLDKLPKSIQRIRPAGATYPG